MKRKSYIDYGCMFNSALYQNICAQIENGTFTAEFGAQHTNTPWLDYGGTLSGTVGQTRWELSIILNPYKDCNALGIDSENATPYVTTSAGKTFELLPQDDYDGCRVINTAQLGHGGGDFGAYLSQLIANWIVEDDIDIIC